MSAQFELRTVITAPVEVVFELSLDIDVHLDSMAASRERAIGGVTSGRIGLGEEVTWRAVHFGFPFTMTSRVTELDRPNCFVDEQLRGPFRRFRHEHYFSDTSGRTTMVDRVSFDARLGPIGDVIERLILGRYMARLIRERAEHVKRVAERRIGRERLFQA